MFLVLVMVLAGVNLPGAATEVWATEDKCEHNYEAEYNWSDNGTSCSITLTCPKNAAHNITGECTITSEVTKNPTCEAKGATTYKATYTHDNRTYTDTMRIVNIYETGHNLQKTDAKAATCTSDGNSAYWYCQKCDKYFSDETGKTEIKKDSWIIKASHKLTKTSAKNPTKSKTGNIAYYHCSACNKSFSDAAGKTEIEKDYWIIPQKSVTVNLGETVKIGEIMNGASKINKMTLPNASKYKKYLTINSKNGTIKTKKYYKQKIKSLIPVKVTTLAGKTYTVNVKIVIPAPKVTIKKELIRYHGQEFYKYIFKYNIKNADKIQVRLKKDGNSSINKGLDTYVSKPKSNKESYIMITKSSMKKLKNKITFKIVAYYGKNKSEAAVIEK